MMKTVQAKAAAAETKRASLLQRKCACGQHTIAGGECEACGKKRLQRRATEQTEPASVPPVVHEVLRSPGQPLDAATRAFMEPRFGHDFSRLGLGTQARPPMQSSLTIGPANDLFEQEADRTARRVASAPLPATAGEGVGYDFGGVRVHTDGAAAESARVVGASAYTVGRDIVFGAGQYAPHTDAGRQLLAHELTHVVQQSGDLHASPAAAGVVQRAISPELEEIESLLSYDILDWKIFDAEAIKALRILQSLPRYQQAVFVSNKKYLERLRDNLPESHGAELELIIGSVADITPPSEEVEAIRSNLSYNIIGWPWNLDWAITDKEAIDALERLKKLKGTQLAVALGAIDYGRLRDNLPDSRKQELTDLMAQGLGKGGARETEEKTHPGVEINSIAFTSDHGLMKDNSGGWANSGSVVEPEWFTGKDRKIISKPISQDKGTSVSIDMSLNVLPLTAPTAPITLTGISDEQALSFNFDGSMQGGMKQSVKMTSRGSLPDAITALRNKQIHWRMRWRDWFHDIGTTTHTIYVTMAAPREPGEVTIKRMSKAIGIIGPLDTLMPHEIVKGIMKNWNRYDLGVPLRQNIWVFADEIDKGGQCIDIVRFVQALIHMVGVPGDAEAVVVWADPADPFTAIESLWGMGSMSLIAPREEGGRTLKPRLLDGSYHSNNFEAALKFNHGGTLAYYPGGVDAVYATKDQVLRVFRCLAWIEPLDETRCRIVEVPANYPDNYGGPTCVPDTIKTCYVKSF